MLGMLLSMLGMLLSMLGILLLILGIVNVDMLFLTVTDTVNQCLSYPCQNAGECVNEAFAFRCNCKTGFSDPTCSTGTVVSSFNHLCPCLCLCLQLCVTSVCPVLD